MPRGFTFIELLLVVALMGIVVFVSIGFAANSVPRNQLRSEADAVTDLLRLAQARSVNGRADGLWGVRVEPSNIVLFKGSSYATRDVPFDERHAFAGSVQASGLSEILFAFRTGVPSQDGVVTLTQVGTESSIKIMVHGSGLIEKQ